jgi:hypothetical protein
VDEIPVVIAVVPSPPDHVPRYTLYVIGAEPVLADHVRVTDPLSAVRDRLEGTDGAIPVVLPPLRT